MPKTKSAQNLNPALRKKLTSLIAKYGKTHEKLRHTELDRLRLLKAIMDLAVDIPHAELHVDTHIAGTKRCTTEHYKLTDPRAALLMFQRFCNVPVPIGNLFCVTKYGCKPTMKRPQDWIGCVLIGCVVNACPTPGGFGTLCFYLCI